MEFSFKETGKRIRYAREIRGLSVQELAALLACSPDHLYKTEQGSRGMSIDLIFSISLTLGVSMNYLTNCPINDEKKKKTKIYREKLINASKLLNEIIEDIKDSDRRECNAVE